MAWSETPKGRISPPVRAEVLDMARRRFRDDDDPGVHSAASLLLRRWGDADLPATTPDAPSKSNPDVRHWERGSQRPHVGFPARSLGVPDGFARSRAGAISL